MKTWPIVAAMMCLAFTGLPLLHGAVAVTYPLFTVSLPDLASHDIYFNTITSAGSSDSTNPSPTTDDTPTLQVGQDGTWQVKVTNTGTVAWTDFHITVTSQLSGVEFIPDVTVTGWGSLPQQKFVLGSDNAVVNGTDLADFAAPAGQVVPFTSGPGSTITLNIPVHNFNATFAVRHHLHFQASVPEPGSVALMTAGMLLLLRRPARKA